MFFYAIICFSMQSFFLCDYTFFGWLYVFSCYYMLFSEISHVILCFQNITMLKTKKQGAEEETGPVHNTRREKKVNR